jgi:uncharacterized phage-like protein YoqJ
MMQPVRELTVFDELTDFLMSRPDDDAILAYKLPHHLQQRGHYLMEQSTEGLLTRDEERELTDFVRVDQLMLSYKSKILEQRTRDRE